MSRVECTLLRHDFEDWLRVAGNKTPIGAQTASGKKIDVKGSSVNDEDVGVFSLGLIAGPLRNNADAIMAREELSLRLNGCGRIVCGFGELCWCQTMLR